MRFFGLALIAAVPVLYGFFQGEKIRRNSKTIGELILFFRHLQFEIQVFARDQKEIYDSFQSDHLVKIGFLPQLMEEVGKDPCGALYRTVRSGKENGQMPEEIIGEVEAYSRDFGMRSRETELEQCGKLILWLERKELGNRDFAKNKIRLCRALGTTVGMGILIILL